MAALLLSRSAGYLAVHNTLQLKLTLMCHCISTLTLSDQERTGGQHRLAAAHNWDRESSYKGATVQSNTIHLSVPVSFTAKYVQNMKSNVNRVAFKVSLHDLNPRQKSKLHIHFQLSLKISYSSIKHTNYKWESWFLCFSSFSWTGLAPASGWSRDHIQHHLVTVSAYFIDNISLSGWLPVMSTLLLAALMWSGNW